MVNRRLARLNEQFKREITALLQSEVRDPRVGPVTVTDVEVTPDLAYARVYVMLGGDDATRQQSLQGLRAAAPFLRGELGRRMHIRRAPELRFELDRSLEHALRIHRLLEQAQSGHVPEDESADGGEAEDS